jgi:hypothetical protein
MTMKYLMRLLIVVSIVALTGCSSEVFVVHQHRGHLPPGQAKKITGSKSAKPYAYGQRKKQN